MKQLFVLIAACFLTLSGLMAQPIVTWEADMPCANQNYLPGSLVVFITGLAEEPTGVTLSGYAPTESLYDPIQDQATYIFSSFTGTVPFSYTTTSEGTQVEILELLPDPAPVVTDLVVLPGNCNPGDYINYTVTGGTAPFTTNFSLYGSPYAPTNPYSTTSESLLWPGELYMNLVDANGCTAYNYFTIPDANADTVTIFGCNGVGIYNGNFYQQGITNVLGASTPDGCNQMTRLNIIDLGSTFYPQNLSVYCDEVILNAYNYYAVDGVLPASVTATWMVGPGGGVINQQVGTTMYGQPDGDYICVLSTTGCTDSLYSTVNTASLSVSLVQSACQDTIMAVINSIDAVGPLDYDWFGSQFDYLIDSSGILNGFNQTISVDVTDANGCTGTGYGYFQQSPIEGWGQNFNNFDCSGNVNLYFMDSAQNYTLLVTGPNNFSEFLDLQTAQPGTPNSNITLQTYDNGIYTLTLTDTETGCVWTKEVVRDLPEISIYKCDDIGYFGITGSDPSYFVNMNPGFLATQTIESGTAAPFTITPPGSTYHYYYISSPTSNFSCGASFYPFMLQDTCPTTLSGYAYLDANDDCVYNTGEIVLPEIVLQVQGTVTATGLLDTFFVLTNANGYYEIVLPEGNYTLLATSPNLLLVGCNTVGSPFSIVADNSIVLHAGLEGLVACALLDVEINSSPMRPCFAGYEVMQVCNEGTITEIDATVVVTFDPSITVTGSTFEYVEVTPDVYSFDLGDLDPFECADVNIEVFVDCDAVVGNTVCVEATATPDSACLADLDGFLIGIEGGCNGDSVQFLIQNFDGPVNDAQYYIVEDQIILMTEPLDMNPASSLLIKRFAEPGKTYWLGVSDGGATAPQAVASAVVEGCNGNPNIWGLFNQFSLNNDLDEYNFTDQTCMILIASFDPNDKTGYPTGHGPQHRILPETTIDYLIRYQNTGTDTAFNIVIRDTLPETLDPATFDAGVHSNYTQVSLNNRVVTFTMPNIMLPDSNINEAASHGFVSYRIKPRTDLAWGTQVLNTASIYFDFNEAVVTNTSMHTIGLELSVSTTEVVDEMPWSVFPNPTSSTLFLQPLVPGADTYKVELTTTMGQQILQKTITSYGDSIEMGSFPAGIYFLAIYTTDGQRMAVRKVVVQD
jgi:uncharacterized repeat protein (TIGR01451 family)